MSIERRGVRKTLASAAIGLIGMAASSADAQPLNPAALPVIEVNRSAEGVEISGRVIGLSEGEIEAEMQIERTGGSGNISTRQAAAWSINAGQAREIAKVGISYASGERLTVSVVIRQKAEIVARAVLEVPGR